MISFKSFFMRTIIFQALAILLLWGVLMGWVKYFYYPDAEKYLDNQQRIVARGIANILDKTDVNDHNFIEVIKDIEIMYIDSIKNGMQDEIDYRPLFVVYDRNNKMLYASPAQEIPLFLPPSVLSGTISYANMKWHIAGSWSDKQQFRVIVGESFDNRTTIFGNPAESTAIPLLLTLAATIAALLSSLKGVTDYHSMTSEQRIEIRRYLLCLDDTAKKVSKLPVLDASEKADLEKLRKDLTTTTEYAPFWVILAVALALGLGTMVGWRRVVKTIGEKIGKQGMTYAQGMAAQITTTIAIGLANVFALPVSTTHILSSGVAGTMVANKSGLQGNTIKTILMAWVLTLPATVGLSAALFWVASIALN